MSVYDEYEPPESNGLFLRGKSFEENKQYRLRIASDPVVFETTYQQTGKKSTKYAWIVYDFEAKIARIMQLPIMSYLDIRDLARNKDWGDPKAYTINVTRTGSDKDTRYSIVPTPSKQSLTNDEEEACFAIDIIKEVTNGNKGAENVEWLEDRAVRKKNLDNVNKTIPGSKEVTG